MGTAMALLHRSTTPTSLALHASGPEKETQQLPPLTPDEAQNVFGLQGLSGLTGICFNAPAQKLTPPGREAMAARCIPDESQGGEQCGSFRIEYRLRAPV